MNAELVLERMAEEIVAGAERTVRIDEELRHEKERDALRAGWRIRQARQNKVDDVVGEVVLAPGDEDLLAEDAVGAVGAALGTGLEHAQIGAGMRLGQVHRPHPLAGDHLRQEGRLQGIGAMLLDRLDRAHRQRRTQREGHGAAVPHLHGGDMQHVRQVLAAEGFRRRQSVPAALNPAMVEVAPALRCLDRAIDEPRALPVADLAERRHLFGRKTTGFRQDRIDEILAEFAEGARVHGLGHAGHVLQGECDLVHRCLVHRAPPFAAAGAGSSALHTPHPICFYVNVNVNSLPAAAAADCNKTVITSE
ncbi:hypothetical protein ABIA14_002599 [Sinorhizobium fredii]